MTYTMTYATCLNNMYNYFYQLPHNACLSISLKKIKMVT